MAREGWGRCTGPQNDYRAIRFEQIGPRKSRADRTAALREELALRFGLTETESAVAEHLLKGFSYESIGQRLGVPPHTVHSHVKSIHRKASVATTLELSALFYESE